MNISNIYNIRMLVKATLDRLSVRDMKIVEKRPFVLAE